MSTSEPSTLSATSLASRLDAIPLGSWHRKLTSIVGLGAFFEYYEVFLSGVLLAVLRPAWGLDAFTGSVLVASVFGGMFVGATFVAPLADRIGRKKLFLLNMCAYLVFGIGAAFAPNIWVLVVFRFLAGIGAGAESALIPTYLGEFLPSRHRGRYIGYALVIGFTSYPIVALLGAPLARITVLMDGWRWLMLAASLGVFLVLWARRALPESPRWLLTVGRSEEAEAETCKIEAASGVDVGRCNPPLTSTVGLEGAPETCGKWSALFAPGNRRITAALSTYSVFAVTAYYGFASLAPVLLVAKGFDIVQSLLYTAVIAVGYPVGALVASVLADRVERKWFLVCASLATAAFGLVFGFAVNELIIIGAGFAISLGSNVISAVTTMYLSEVFPTRIRSTGIGFSYGLGRIAATALPFLGLPILAIFGPVGVLTACAALYAVAATSIAILGPKTTGRQLEAVSEL